MGLPWLLISSAFGQPARTHMTRTLTVMWQQPYAWIRLALAILLLAPSLYASNKVMGEVELRGQTKVERDSGVWVDGQYVGYLKELKGNKKILLLPGEHTISVRQDGYQDFNQTVNVEPDKKLTVMVEMQKAPTTAYSGPMASLKMTVNPLRAAVFIDGQLIGHVGEFQGLGHALLVPPGPHRIRIALPGYQTFETEIDAVAHQKLEVKTTLLKESGPVVDPRLKSPSSGDETPPPPPPPPPSSPFAIRSGCPK